MGEESELLLSHFAYSQSGEIEVHHGGTSADRADREHYFFSGCVQAEHGHDIEGSVCDECDGQ